MRSAAGSSAFSSNNAASAGSSRVARRALAGLAASRVHAQIEWAVVLVCEAASRVVDLHGRDSKIRENNVCWFGKYFRKARKIRPVHFQAIGTKSEGAQTGFGFRQFDRIDVESDQPAARLER